MKKNLVDWIDEFAAELENPEAPVAEDGEGARRTQVRIAERLRHAAKAERERIEFAQQERFDEAVRNVALAAIDDGVTCRSEVAEWIRSYVDLSPSAQAAFLVFRVSRAIDEELARRRQEGLKTASVLIGNSDDKLPQHKWAEYWHIVHARILQNCTEIHFSGMSNPRSAWQNAAWVFEMPAQDCESFKAALASIAGEYQQDSIAWVEGDTQFLLGNVAE